MGCRLCTTDCRTGLSEVALPILETGIAISVLLMGLLLVVLPRVTAGSGVVLIALFAVFHGSPQGLEMPSSVAHVMYADGLLMAISLLHLCGVKLGNLFITCYGEIQVDG